MHLLRNQRLQVGNTAWADFAVRDDARMAELHFALETDYHVCRLRDLSNGATLLNGEKAPELAVLKSGDEITAGDSKFIVQVEGADPAAVGAAHTGSAAVVAPKGAASVEALRPRPPAPKDQHQFRKEQCDSGAWRYYGSAATTKAGELVRPLGSLWPVTLMIDFRRAKISPPDSAASAPPLFDWLGPAAATLSPFVLGPGSIDDPAALVEQAWGLDGVVCLFSTKSAEEINDHLRKQVRVDSHKVIGVCWPGILGQILAHYRPEFVQKFLSIASAVLVEGGEGGAEWNLFSLSQQEETLLSLGFKLKEEEQAAAA
jgi:hypothetical protein